MTLSKIGSLDLDLVAALRSFGLSEELGSISSHGVNGLLKFLNINVVSL